MFREAGLDPRTAMRLAGHKEHRTTLHIYTHIEKENLDGAEEALNVFFGKVAEKLPEQKNEL